jgi:hypothetical protein
MVLNFYENKYCGDCFSLKMPIMVKINKCLNNPLIEIPNLREVIGFIYFDKKSDLMKITKGNGHGMMELDLLKFSSNNIDKCKIEIIDKLTFSTPKEVLKNKSVFNNYSEDYIKWNNPTAKYNCCISFKVKIELFKFHEISFCSLMPYGNQCEIEAKIVKFMLENNCKKTLSNFSNSKKGNKCVKNSINSITHYNKKLLNYYKKNKKHKISKSCKIKENKKIINNKKNSIRNKANIIENKINKKNKDNKIKLKYIKNCNKTSNSTNIIKLKEDKFIHHNNKTCAKIGKGINILKELKKENCTNVILRKKKIRFNNSKNENRNKIPNKLIPMTIKQKICIKNLSDKKILKKDKPNKRNIIKKDKINKKKIIIKCKTNKKVLKKVTLDKRKTMMKDKPNKRKILEKDKNFKKISKCENVKKFSDRLNHNKIQKLKLMKIIAKKKKRERNNKKTKINKNVSEKKNNKKSSKISLWKLRLKIKNAKKSKRIKLPKEKLRLIKNKNLLRIKNKRKKIEKDKLIMMKYRTPFSANNYPPQNSNIKSKKLKKSYTCDIKKILNGRSNNFFLKRIKNPRVIPNNNNIKYVNKRLKKNKFYNKNKRLNYKKINSKKNSFLKLKDIKKRKSIEKTNKNMRKIKKENNSRIKKRHKRIKNMSKDEINPKKEKKINKEKIKNKVCLIS